MNAGAPRTGAASQADVATPKASRYLQQLCKHFQHKRPVTFDPQAGEITFSIGVCRVNADEDTLTLALTAPDSDQMTQLEQIIARHLLRFAFREDMQIDWRRT
jgi:hypothetical protein